ncbi:hypothetical protein TSUD_359440 [Trifolium subterraneum]|uniref:Uncharacterized protein n=1 Tax=Trifolium subterraneum TaxID=3900 RepID=A0A2Z6NK31_TRISU|nr:hypothetical protein TSUD_359440 [Trifolium subterraneum]
MQMVTALLSLYDEKEDYFVFEFTTQTGTKKIFHLDFGLEDTIYITGLAIDGKQVSGYESSNHVETIKECLEVSSDDVEELLVTKENRKCFDINLNKLKTKFELVPPNISDFDLELFVMVYLLYLLGYPRLQF